MGLFFLHVFVLHAFVGFGIRVFDTGLGHTATTGLVAPEHPVTVRIRPAQPPFYQMEWDWIGTVSPQGLRIQTACMHACGLVWVLWFVSTTRANDPGKY